MGQKTLEERLEALRRGQAPALRGSTEGIGRERIATPGDAGLAMTGEGQGAALREAPSSAPYGGTFPLEGGRLEGQGQRTLGERLEALRRGEGRPAGGVGPYTGQGQGPMRTSAPTHVSVGADILGGPPQVEETGRRVWDDAPYVQGAGIAGSTAMPYAAGSQRVELP